MLPCYLSTAVIGLLSSGHNFAVETGRWNKTPKEERKCLHCNEVEDERHALFTCPCYDHCRTEMKGWLHSKIQIQSPTASDLEKFFLESLQNRADWTERDIRSLFVVAKFVHLIIKDAYSAFSGDLILFWAGRCGDIVRLPLLLASFLKSLPQCSFMRGAEYPMNINRN